MNKLTGFLIAFSFFGYCFSQTLPSSELLGQAEEMVSYDPAEARAIAQHEFAKTIHQNEKAKALYLTALSYYISGNYDVALNEAYMSRDLAVETGSKKYEEKSKELIEKILSILYLSREDSPREIWEAKVFKLEKLALEGVMAVLEDDLDLAKNRVGQIEAFISKDKEGYGEMIYYGLWGDIMFKEKKFDSSLYYYNTALEAGRKLENSYVEKELNQKLAANYLVLDSLSNFQELSQKIEMGNIEFADIENRASNDAFVLESARLENKLDGIKKRFSTWFYTLGILFVLLVVWGMIQFVRNKRNLEMYGRMLNYFESSDETVKVKSPKKSGTHHERKTAMPLKSSEDQIVKALKRFESGTKFTMKEMSLGMLAAELNTNTKYLSEVINRYKEKNFNAYINELRIAYIIRKIRTDPKYLKYKVSYLADESGFSSHSTFTTVFKSIVGVSPIKFIEFVKAEKETEKEHS